MASLSRVVIFGLVISLWSTSQQPLWAKVQLSPVAQQTLKMQADQIYQRGFEQYQRQDAAAAIASWQEALSLYRQLHDRERETATLIALGSGYLALQKYEQAIALFQHGIEIAKSRNDAFSQAQALANLGIAYKSLGRYSEAIATQQQALTLMQTLGNRQGEGQVLVNLGNAYEAVGDYLQAQEVYQASLVIVRELGDRAGEGIALSNLGAIDAAQGRYAQAIDYYQQSLTIAQTIGDLTGQAHISLNLASAYQARKEYQTATAYYQNSLQIARKVRARDLESQSLGGLGTISAQQGNFSQAIAYHEQSVAIAQQIGDPRLMGLTLNNLGHALFESGDLIAAETKLRAASDQLESLRPIADDAYNISIFDTQVLSYNLLQQILIAQNKVAEALEISERGRARAFVERLARRTSNGQSQTAQDLRLFHRPTLAQIQQVAKDQNATLVEYAIVPEDEFAFAGKLRGREAELLIWVVQPTGEVGFRRVDLRSLPLPNLQDLVAIARESLGARGRGIAVVPAAISTEKQTAQLKTLHQLLIEPIADLLPSDPQARVIFIPQESLFLVPFAALQSADDTYLIEQHTILTAPSIQVLAFTHQAQPLTDRTNIQNSIGADSTNNHSLIVGNPTMPEVTFTPGKPPQQLEPLPGAEKEAIAIAKLLQTKAITGKQATKAEVLKRLPQSRIIHFATHGLLEYGQAPHHNSDLPGAIALAPSPRDTGLLTATEILDLSLQANLVILSACDTGRGQITGDGVLGLSRSFLTAGAASVVVSLWAVPDAPTSELMTEFYRQMQHHPDKAQALRQAMLKTMQHYPNPVNWAAFTLVGEAQ